MSEKDDIVQYRTPRSEEAVEEAKLLAAEEHRNAAMNRLYYAFYYSVPALLHSEGSFAKTHSGLKNQFSQQSVATNRRDAAYGESCPLLFAGRQESDAAGFVVFTKTGVASLIGEVANFTAEANRLPTT